MNRTIRLSITIWFILLLSTAAIASGGKAPAWLLKAAKMKNPSYDKDVPAVVLLDEQRVSLTGRGKLRVVEKYAVRILTMEGKDLARATVFYLVSTEKLSGMKGWAIAPSGSTREFGKDSILDMISDPDDVYNEGRIRVIDASDEVSTGHVFGYTVTSEYDPLFYQDVWQFQSRLPTLVSRYSLNLPAGWSASSITFNHAEVAPAVSGTSYTWELRGLGPIPPEPMSLSVSNLVPFMAVNFRPGDVSKARNRVFSNWTEVSEWASPLYDPQVIVNDEIAAKARELTANAETELDKIKAIGTYVQNLQYISIDIGVGYGNGYKPRPSDLVLKRGYGDCKDKATLMRAMLRALKIDAYPIAIFSGDPTFVRKEWASPRQFNHCIIAIRVSNQTKSDVIIEDAKLGRLLIFDATDDLTPVGDLPDYLQGSRGLVIAGDNGSLLKMPITTPEMNSLERNVTAALTSAGTVTGTIREHSRGQSSKYERLLYRKSSKTEYRKLIERWLTSGSSGARLVDFEPKDDHKNATFDLKVEFAAPSYGQLMQNRLLIFKPAIVSRLRSIYLTEKERSNPVRLESNSFSETAVIDLPEGFIVDEVPDAVDLQTSFGSYSTSYRVEKGKLFFKRSLSTGRAVVPTAQYATVRDFYTKILEAEQSVVVLVRN